LITCAFHHYNPKNVVQTAQGKVTVNNYSYLKKIIFPLCFFYSFISGYWLCYEAPSSKWNLLPHGQSGLSSTLQGKQKSN
jgi:hypothetical protein